MKSFFVDKIRSWPTGRRFEDLLIATLIMLPLTYVFLLALLTSLDWHCQHDLPIMMYMGFLMDRFGFVPYSDFFDMNMLGSQLVYLSLGHLFGYSDEALRWADLTFLSVISLLTLLVLRRIGYRVAWIAVVMFGLIYISFGPLLSLQREYIMLVPMLFAVWTVLSHQSEYKKRRAFFSGLGMGLAAAIKPHTLIGLIPIGIYLWTENWEEEKLFLPRLRGAAVLAGYMFAGVAVPLGVFFTVLVYTGTLNNFVMLVSQYLPLYSKMSESVHIIEGPQRVNYLIDKVYQLGGHQLLALGAAMGVAFYFLLGYPDRGQRRQVLLMVGMGCAYIIYPIFSGQFWFYHWLPFVYWLIACISLLTVVLPRNVTLRKRWIPLLVFVLLAFYMIRPDRDHNPVSKFQSYGAQRHARSHAIADFLQKNLRSGETVQPLDWTSAGIVHALLIAEAKVATPFLYDFHFYHHVSTDYIQNLRRRFILALNDSKPRFIVKGKLGPFPKGKDTSRNFLELQWILTKKYHVVFDNSEFTIYERSDTGKALDGGIKKPLFG